MISFECCWFVGKILSNFVSPAWKLHNGYCHDFKAVEGGACIGESWAAFFTGGGICQAAGGACTATEAFYIGLQRECEEYCDGKFPSKFDKIQENLNLTRKV